MPPRPSLAVATRLAFLLAFPRHASSSSASPGQWVLEWSDDFTGPAVNTSLWNVYANVSEGSPPSWNQIELYTADNVFIEDGALVLRTRPQNVSVGGRSFNVTSGRVDTKGLANVTAPFRLEVSARLQDDARASGIHTAHWLLGYACWPRGAELDIMEMQSPGNQYGDHACNRSRWPVATSNFHTGDGACGAETHHTTGSSAWPTSPSSPAGVDFSAYYTRFWTELNATDLVFGVNETVVNHLYVGMPGWGNATWSLPTWPMFAILSQAYMAQRPCGDPAPEDWPVLQRIDYVRAWRWEAGAV